MYVVTFFVSKLSIHSVRNLAKKLSTSPAIYFSVENTECRIFVSHSSISTLLMIIKEKIKEPISSNKFYRNFDII